MITSEQPVYMQEAFESFVVIRLIYHRVKKFILLSSIYDIKQENADVVLAIKFGKG